jgi:hypothetical protein
MWRFFLGESRALPRSGDYMPAEQRTISRDHADNHGMAQNNGKNASGSRFD